LKEIKLNFKLNEKTPNGRVYNQENFIQKIDEQIRKGTFFFEYSGNYSSMEVDLKKIIGFIESCTIHKNGDIIFSVIANNEADNKYLNVIDDCTLSASGYTDRKGNALINRIVCLRPSPEYGLVLDGLENEEDIQNEEE
jgi:hypothetical protein